MNLDAVFQPGLVSLFFLSTFYEFEMGSLAEYSILIVYGQDKKTHLHFQKLQSPTRPLR